MVGIVKDSTPSSSLNLTYHAGVVEALLLLWNIIVLNRHSYPSVLTVARTQPSSLRKVHIVRRTVSSCVHGENAMKLIYGGNGKAKDIFFTVVTLMEFGILCNH